MKHTLSGLRRAARDLAEELGRCPSSNEFGRRTGVSSSTISRHGGWSRVVEGLPKRLRAEKKPARRRADREVMRDLDRPARELRHLEARQSYLVTCAVSDCPAEDGFLAAARVWEEETGGKLLAVPILYKNPTRREGGEEPTWDSRLAGDLLSQEIRPHPQLSIVPTKIAATTNNPLPPRMLAMTGECSAVFGHPQVAMKTVPTRPGKRAKILYTSGAITRPDYSDTPTGEVGAFNHALAATVVEVDGDDFWLRDVHWNGRGIVDVDSEYRPDGVHRAAPAAAIKLGDVHVGLDDPELVRGALLDPGSLLARTRAQAVYLEDLFDGRSLNPHRRGKALTLAAAAARGEDDVAAELASVREWLDALPEGPAYRVTRSNHDLFLERWLEAGSPDPRNAEVFHFLAWRVLSERRRTGYEPIALRLAMGDDLRADVEWLTENDSSVVAGFECSQHGHVGPNGSRGTPASFARVGVKTATGHTHSPCIWQGNRTAGMSTVSDHGYNRGLSSWDQAAVLIHACGHSQTIFFRRGRYRA